MSYNSSDFESGKCPHCGSSDVSKEHNLMNLAVAHGAGYFFDFPFDSSYECNKCGASNSDDCFIATAVYGDRNAPQVKTLRQYRDDVLMQSAPGRAFVKFYYSGVGRKAAGFIREKIPDAIPVIRTGLDWLIERYTSESQD